MAQPAIHTDTIPYLDALCAGTGESMAGALHRVVVFAYKHMISRPKYRHLEIHTSRKTRGQDRTDNV